MYINDNNYNMVVNQKKVTWMCRYSPCLYFQDSASPTVTGLYVHDNFFQTV